MTKATSISSAKLRGPEIFPLRLTQTLRLTEIIARDLSLRSIDEQLAHSLGLPDTDPVSSGTADCASIVLQSLGSALDALRVGMAYNDRDQKLLANYKNTVNSVRVAFRGLQQEALDACLTFADSIELARNGTPIGHLTLLHSANLPFYTNPQGVTVARKVAVRSVAEPCEDGGELIRNYARLVYVLDDAKTGRVTFYGCQDVHDAPLENYILERGHSKESRVHYLGRAHQEALLASISAIHDWHKHLKAAQKPAPYDPEVILFP